MRIADHSRVWTTHGLGGMQVRAAIAARGLAQRGHQVHVFTTAVQDRDVREVEDDGVIVHHLPGTNPGKYSTEYFDAAQAALREAGPFDVIHSNSSAGRRHTGRGVPVVATWHGIGSLRDDENLVKIGGRPHGSRFDESIRRYDHSIVVGFHESELLVEHDIPRDRVHFVPHGLDERIFAPNIEARERMRHRLGIRSHDFVAGIAGRLVFDKGVTQVLAAIGRMDCSVKLLIIGEGNAVEATAGGLGRIVRAPVCRHDEMPSYYNAMDLLVNATASYQGFDMTTVEAMLCGTPVLLAESSPAKEILVCGAEFFRLGEAAHLAGRINDIVRSGHAPELGKAARAFAELFFTQEQMIGGIEGVLNAAVGN